VIRRKLAVQRDLLLVGTLDGRLVATVIGGWDGHRGWIYHLAVAPRSAAGDRAPHDAGGRGAPPRPRLPQGQPPDTGLQRDAVGFYERLGFAIEDRVSMGKQLG